MKTPVYFLVFGIFAAGLYLFYSRQMNRTYVGTLLDTLKERLFLPDKHMYSDLQGSGDKALEEIMRGINNADEEVSVAFAKVLVGSFPDKAAAIILERAGNMQTATADRALSLLAPLELSACTDELHRLASNGDSHLQTTVMRLLLDKNHKASITEAIAQLHSSNPRMLSTAIHAALRYPHAHSHRNKVFAAWQSLLQSNTACRCAAMDNMPDFNLLGSVEQQSLQPDYLDAFISLLAEASEHTSLCALQGLQQWKQAISPELAKAVIQATTSDNPQLREAAVSCLHLISDERRNKLIIRAISDGHIRVREAGIAMLQSVSNDYNETALQWIFGNQASLRAQNTLMTSLMNAHLPRSTYEEIAQIKSREILLLQDALVILEQDNKTTVNSARHLLRYTLKEQLDQTVELVLLALESLYDKETIRIIHAGFTCGDSRHIANACEVLGNLVKDSSICNLCDALLRASGEDPGHWNPSFVSIDDVLQWCANHGNNWLSECGKQALQPAGKFNA